MAVEKVIEIKVDAKQATQEINNIKEGVNNTSESTSALGSKLDSVTGGAVTKLKGFTAALGSVAGGFKSVGAAIALSGLGLLVITIAAVSAAFKGSEEGQNKFAKILSVIGAITGNLIDLLADFGEVVISVFENPTKAINSFGNLIKENIVNRFNGLLELIPQLGKAVSQLFSGDFSEAAETATNAVAKVSLGVEDVTGKIKDATEATKDFIDQNIREAKAAAKVADQRAQADTIERNLIVQKANAEREIATLRLKAKDLNNVSAKEREEALLKVLSIQDQLITQETKVLELRRDAQIAENTFARSDKENLLAEEQAKAAVIAAETRRTDQKRQIQRELTAAENEQRAAEKARFKEKQDEQKALAKAEEDRLKKIQDLNDKFKKQNEDLDAKTLEEKLQLDRDRAEADLNNLIGTETEKREAKLQLDEFYDQREAELKEQRRLEQEQKDQDLAKKEETKRKEREAKELADAQTVADAKEQIRNANINNISAGIGLLKNLAGKSEALQAASVVAENAVGIGKTIINTQAANAAVTAKYALLPGGLALAAAERTANNVSAGISVAASLLATKNALSQLKGKGGASPKGGSVGSGGGGGISAPSFNLVQGTGSNQIAEGLNTQNEPIKAFVVSGDVTTAQNLDNNIIEDGSI